MPGVSGYASLWIRCLPLDLLPSLLIHCLPSDPLPPFRATALVKLWATNDSDLRFKMVWLQFLRVYYRSRFFIFLWMSLWFCKLLRNWNCPSTLFLRQVREKIRHNLNSNIGTNLSHHRVRGLCLIELNMFWVQALFFCFGLVLCACVGESEYTSSTLKIILWRFSLHFKTHCVPFLVFFLACQCRIYILSLRLFPINPFLIFLFLLAF